VPPGLRPHERLVVKTSAEDLAEYVIDGAEIEPGTRLPICMMAFGSSAPLPTIPRGRRSLKLRPTIETPFASNADASVSPA
jgi:hypothetical protein